MKKLMIALAAVAMGFAANAASVNWSASAIYAPGTSSAASGYYVYCFESSTLSYSSAVAKLAAGDTTFLASALGGTYAGTVNAYKSFSKSGLGTVTDGKGTTGYMVILDDDDKPSLAYITAELTGSVSGDTGTPAKQAFGKLDGTNAAGGSDTRVKSNWYTVPEPCSGLLMLVGMGALALRRRRA